MSNKKNPFMARRKGEKKQEVENIDIVVPEAVTLTETSSKSSIKDDRFVERKLNKVKGFNKYKVIGAVSLLSILGIIGGSFTLNMYSGKLKTVTTLGNDLSFNAQKINVLYPESIQGKDESLLELKRSVENIEKTYGVYRSEIGGVEQLQGLITTIKKNYEVLNKNFSLFRSSKERIVGFNSDVRALDKGIDEFINIYTRTSLNVNELRNAYDLKVQLQAISGYYSSIVLSDTVTDESISKLEVARDNIKNILISLKDGDASKNIRAISSRELTGAYNGIVKSWSDVSKNVNLLTLNSKDMMLTKSLIELTYKATDSIIKNNNNILGAYTSSAETKVLISQIILSVSLMLLLISLLLTNIIYLKEKEQRVSEDRRKKALLEDDIKKMADDLIKVESGNLSKTLDVSDGIIGYISDSINITIEALRNLVTKVKDISVVLGDRASDVNGIALNMMTVTQKQKKSIDDVGNSVIDITRAINVIAVKAQDGELEARNSLEVSNSGSQKVDDYLRRMEDIKTNVDNTVILMDKASKSVEEIQTIVYILNEINQDTEILSLNATIQATKAGSDGKSFKMLGDLVKELAKKAASEGRRVDNLVKGVMESMQTVNDALVKTKQEVEIGLDLSKKVSDSFADMKQSSEKISSVVKTISDETKEQARKAEIVQDGMRFVIESTKEQVKASDDTVKSIQEILEASQNMVKSVKPFKISKDDID